MTLTADRRPSLAFKMAELEASLGLRTTYYFRASPPSFDPAIITRVSQLGHEIGYHYEDLSHCRGSVVDALKSFRRNLENLRRLTPVCTAAMHGSPLSPFNNLDIWKASHLSSFDLLGKAFLTIDYHGLFYFTDTGQSWCASATNLRDRPQGARYPNPPVCTTRQLAKFIEAGTSQRLAICTHPERWDTTMTGWWPDPESGTDQK